jgi:hypothetical protein
MRCPIHVCAFYDLATERFLGQRLTVGNYFDRREIILAPGEAAIICDNLLSLWPIKA